ncbi:hypothetical protein LTR84_009942 [Exophiala bonariae]|uniref:Autophagy-related protein 16 domain-containing protein n=1 Tax=Exophiala bonariae TaxID=1690606 RepID=A0AAV9NM70_9EURO|nr:hypothetical protein LTR84_009942 [Exophiala bonariae]
MATWTEKYLAALQERDAREKANLNLYDHCTKLADKNAELQTQLRQAPTEEPEQATPTATPSLVGRGLRRVTSPVAGTTAVESNTTVSAQLRQDLTKAQQERGDLQVRLDSALKELETLKGRAKADSKRMNQLNAGVSQLTIKLKDREEELRGKAKLVENVQDENVTLNLQLNMAEEQSDKLRQENKELVDRWMARMGKEADKMNEQHKFS